MWYGKRIILWPGAFDNTPLKLKLISPEYKETGEEFN
jgi:hypothetical protein